MPPEVEAPADEVPAVGAILPAVATSTVSPLSADLKLHTPATSRIIHMVKIICLQLQILHQQHQVLEATELLKTFHASSEEFKNSYYDICQKILTNPII